MNKINLEGITSKIVEWENRLSEIYANIEFLEKLVVDIQSNKIQIETEIKKFKMYKKEFEKKIRYYKRLFSLKTAKDYVFEKMRPMDESESKIVNTYCEKNHITYNELRSNNRKRPVQDKRVDIYIQLRWIWRTLERIWFLFNRTHWSILSALYRREKSLLKNSKKPVKKWIKYDLWLIHTLY